jgi:integrase
MVDRDGTLRYIRTKTGIQAVLPLPPHMIELLREIPLAPNSIPDMPFRTRGINLLSDYVNWSRAIRRAMVTAGVTKVQLIEKSGVPAYDKNGNPITKGVYIKMLRHTFAVGWLETGADQEAVARMLGHKNTEMVVEHYAPWVKGLDDAHVAKLRALMDEAKPKKGLKIVASGGREVSSANH